MGARLNGIIFDYLKWP